MGAEGGTPGWKLSGISAEEYANLLIAYDAELAKDDYVLGATVFTSGAPEDWQAFDVDEISQWMPGGVAPTIPQEEPMADDSKIEQLLAQNALITAALIDFRHGRFAGADGMDGKIVALNGGIVPEGWAPSYPPKD